jgi:hypothetical protein
MDNPKQEGEEDIPLLAPEDEANFDPEYFGDETAVSPALTAVINLNLS